MWIQILRTAEEAAAMGRRTLYLLEGGALRERRMDEFFPFLREPGHTAALVGAGGKTSLMYALAEEQSRRGWRVAVTTTTHIFRPEDGSACGSIRECRDRWARGRYAVWGKEAPGGKLSALDGADLRLLLGEAEAAFVEADGARRMPCKVPAAHEPQIPPQADAVIAVMGLAALGWPLEDVCFRREEAMDLLRCAGDHILTAEDLAGILTSDRGARKGAGDRAYYIVLNQCDGREEQGRDVLRLLGGAFPAAMTCLRRDGGAYDRD